MSEVNQNALWDEFLRAWPAERVRAMTLDEYTNAKASDCFIYWLEFRGAMLGSIAGGSAFKFGIFRRRSSSSGLLQGTLTDGKYSWYQQYGNTAEEAFQTIHERLVQVVDAAERGDLDSIEKVHVGGASLKWKVAFIYQDRAAPRILPVYKKDWLFVHYKKVVPDAIESRTTHAEMYPVVFDLYRDKGDVFEIQHEVWTRAKAALETTSEDIDEDSGDWSEDDEESMEAETSAEPHAPTNLILYGPPGTGKTHSVRERALELLGVQTQGLPEDELRRQWDRLYGEGRIVFCTFHQAFAYEEFVEGLRASTDDDGGVRYHVESGVFKRIAESAERAWRGSASVDVSGDDFEWRWNRFLDSLPLTLENKDLARGAYRYSLGANGGVQSNPVGVDDASMQPVTRVHVQAYWESRNEWGPEASKLRSAEAKRLVSDATGTGGGHNYAPSRLVYDYLHKMSARPHACPQYVLVIDEINRANIARVFGELITLLEPDKRLGMPSALRLTLPASKTSFGVPPNLHIIGTMNTADRSIALMDVALRRRFQFEEMLPKSEVIKAVLAANDVDGALSELVCLVFDTINARIRRIYDRDHQIGHAYFLGVRTLVDLRDVFVRSVIPLLQEYFYGAWDRVAIVLGCPYDDDGNLLRKNDYPVITIVADEDDDVLGFQSHDYERVFDFVVEPQFARASCDGESDGLLLPYFLGILNDKARNDWSARFADFVDAMGAAR